MKITNCFNLPERIIRLIPERRQPKEGRIGVTSVIDSPRIRTLQLTKWDDIVCDYSDFLATLIGIAMHQRNEKFATEDDEAEHKIVIKIDGVDVVGIADNYVKEDKTIIDTKTKAVGFTRYGGEEITQQLNMYALLQRLNGNEVERLVADIFYRDHKLWELKMALQKKGVTVVPGQPIPTIDCGYPTLSYEEMEIPLWSQEKQMEFLKDQLHYHSASPMDCPMENRWQRKPSWAVWKTGNKRASKICYTKEDADKYLSEKKLSYIEERPGSCIRCAEYCNVRTVCVDSPCYIGVETRGFVHAQKSKILEGGKHEF